MIENDVTVSKQEKLSHSNSTVTTEYRNGEAFAKLQFTLRVVEMGSLQFLSLHFRDSDVLKFT